MEYIRVKAGFLLAFLLLTGLQQPVAQEYYRVDARLDTNRLKIGDQIHLHITLHQPGKAHVEFPSLEDRLAGGVEVIKAFPRDTLRKKQAGPLVIEQKYLITSFDTGSVRIPPMPFYYESRAGRDSLLSPPRNLYVEAVRVDTTREIFDIKGPFGAPLTIGELLPYILGALALVLLVWGILYAIRKRKRREPVFQPKKPAEPAHVYALRELDRLGEEKPWKNGRVKHYYTRLTDILRNYLWMRYGIKTLERTTDEILASLSDSELDEQQAYDQLADNLRFADLVKFARLRPQANESESALQRAYEFVHKTKYVPQDQTQKEKEEQQHGSVQDTQNDQGAS
ncbi:MAG TPA: hypothetical protein VJ876_03260 [Bacteroidales bacterium]|nr:hypothetical protein [Bacteroidales bacterium]